MNLSTRESRQEKELARAKHDAELARIKAEEAEYVDRALRAATRS